MEVTLEDPALEVARWLDHFHPLEYYKVIRYIESKGVKSTLKEEDFIQIVENVCPDHHYYFLQYGRIKDYARDWFKKCFIVDKAGQYELKEYNEFELFFKLKNTDSYLFQAIMNSIEEVPDYNLDDHIDNYDSEMCTELCEYEGRTIAGTYSDKHTETSCDLVVGVDMTKGQCIPFSYKTEKRRPTGPEKTVYRKENTDVFFVYAERNENTDYESIIDNILQVVAAYYSRKKEDADTKIHTAMSFSF